MAAKWHTNKETGETGRCSAEKGRCPFGNAEEHFYTKREATEAYEILQQKLADSPLAAVKALQASLGEPEGLDWDSVQSAFQYVEEWEEDWTETERRNFKLVERIQKVLVSEPVDFEKAQKLFKTLRPYKVYPARGGWNGNDNNWRARDKMLHHLARDLIATARGKQLTYEPIEPITNERLVGLELAQENALNLYNRPSSDFYNGPVYGAVEPYLQESIARVARGDEHADFIEGQDQRSTLPVQERLFNALNPKSEHLFIQQLHLATVWPANELRTEMNAIGVDTVSVSSFENGREWGNVYSVIQPDGVIRAFSVYEHRNSDSIIINGKEGWVAGTLPYAANSKQNFFAEISVGDRRQAARVLAFFMKEAQLGQLPSDQVLDRMAPRLDWRAILGERAPGFAAWIEKREPLIMKKKGTDEDILDRLDF